MSYGSHMDQDFQAFTELFCAQYCCIIWSRKLKHQTCPCLLSNRVRYSIKRWRQRKENCLGCLDLECLPWTNTSAKDVITTKYRKWEHGSTWNICCIPLWSNKQQQHSKASKTRTVFRKREHLKIFYQQEKLSIACSLSRRLRLGSKMDITATSQGQLPWACSLWMQDCLPWALVHESQLNSMVCTGLCKCTENASRSQCSILDWNVVLYWNSVS